MHHLDYWGSVIVLMEVTSEALEIVRDENMAVSDSLPIDKLLPRLERPV
jgi:hypothetical protein